MPYKKNPCLDCKKLCTGLSKRCRKCHDIFAIGENSNSYCKIKVVCKNCNKEFLTHKYRPKVDKGKFCSKKCYWEDMKTRTQENSSNWRGGINPLVMRIRKCFEYKLWRTRIFEIDDFTCQDCKTKGGKLEAHHIKPFSKIFHENNIKSYEEAISCKELWDINNGKTLCIDCHKNHTREFQKSNLKSNWINQFTINSIKI